MQLKDNTQLDDDFEVAAIGKLLHKRDLLLKPKKINRRGGLFFRSFEEICVQQRQCFGWIYSEKRNRIIQ